MLATTATLQPSCSPACLARQPTRPRCATKACRVTCRLRAAIRRSPRVSRGDPLVTASTSESQGSPVYQGVYGPWQIDEADVREVTAYRVSLTVATAAFVAGAAGALLPDGTLPAKLLSDYGNVLCLVGAGSLGTALLLIHIYVAPLKRFVQLLWAAGTLGGLYLMTTQDVPLPQYVAEHPGSMWLVGPLFAAVTGLAFKEGMCYGKPESAALFFTIPALCLAQLSGRCPEPLEHGLLATVAVLAAIFAARKYTQPIKDDIGDKSVFTFRALPPQEQEAVLRRLQAAEARAAMGNTMNDSDL